MSTPDEDAYQLALGRLDLLVRTAQNKFDAVSASDVADYFPDAVARAEIALQAAMLARELADPDYVAWVQVAKRGGVAHAVRDATRRVTLCGRELPAEAHPSDGIPRCARCTAAL